MKIMKELTRAALRAAYQWGRDNGSSRSDKNFNDFLETTIAKELLTKAEKLPISDVSDRRELLISFGKHMNPDWDYGLIVNDVETFIAENQ